MTNILTATIDGTSVSLKDQSFRRPKTLDGRSTCTFVLEDSTGLLRYVPGQKIEITDSFRGRIFKGFIAQAHRLNLYPQPNNLFTITAVDNIYLADKRSYAGVEFDNRMAGDVATELINVLQAQNEGIKTSYALDSDSNQMQFATGVLSGVSTTPANGGDLELSPAGNSHIYQLPAYAVPSFNCLKYEALAIQGFNNNYSYRMIYNVNGAYTVVTGDQLTYDVWISSTSPEIKASVDIAFTDGTYFRDDTTAGKDFQSIPAHASNDLNGFANDQWYTRTFGTSAAMVGKHISYFSLAFEGDSAGIYTAYFRRIKLFNASTVKIDVFNDTMTAPQTNKQYSSNGYSGVNNGQVVYVVSAHDKIFSVFDSENLADVGYIKSSNVTWDASQIPADADFYIQHSIDNGTSRQIATNGGAIPNLTPGMSTLGRSLFTWKYIVQGVDPTATTMLPGSTHSVTSAPTNSTSGIDIYKKYDQNFEWDSGTYTNARSGGQSNLQMQGGYNSFATDSGSTIVKFGNGSPFTRIAQNSLAVDCSGTGNDARIRLDWAGSWQNFTLDVDVLVNTGYTDGIVYRTTNWGTANDTYAYAVSLSTTQVLLGRGTNSTTTGGFSTVASGTISLAANTWHHITLIVNGSNHQVFVDGIPCLNATDTTYSASGLIALRVYSTSAGTISGGFKNFGVINGLSSTWLSPSISLAGAGTAGQNAIVWDNSQSTTDGLTYIPQGSTLVVESSINGGTTWATATNGGAIPGITPGQSLSSVSLLLRITLSTQSASYQPTVGGISVWQATNYLASGSRVASPLYLGNVGRAGSTLVSWAGYLPSTAANLYVDTSLDGFAYTQIGSGANGSANIAGITVQPDPYLDDFLQSSGMFYINTAKSGGTVGTWTQDTTTGRILASSPGPSSGALYLYTLLNALDVDISSTIDSAAGAGFVARYVDAQNMYYCLINDSASSTSPNTVKLYKIASNVISLLATQAISFTHGTPHTFTFTAHKNVMTFIMDGVQIASYTDGSALSAGLTGLYCDTSTATYYFFRVQAWGDDVSSSPAKQVFTRVRMTTTDPTATPQLYAISTSVHNPNIGNGVLIPTTNYSVLSGSKNSIAQDLDDLARQSDYRCYIDDDGELFFRGRLAELAPWPITPADVQKDGIQVDDGDDHYRDSHWATGGVDVVLRSDSFVGDGNTKTFTLGYPVDSIVSMDINTISASFGVKGADTNKQYYYEVGNNQIVQNDTSTALSIAQTLTVHSYGRVPITTNVKRDTDIAARAAIDKTSGIIEVSEDAPGLNKAALITLADSRLTQFCKSARTIKLVTLRDGLEPGQLVPVFLPSYGFASDLLLITDVELSYKTVFDPVTGQQILQPWYTIQLTEGAVVGDWSKWFLNLSKGQ